MIEAGKTKPSRPGIRSGLATVIPLLSRYAPAVCCGADGRFHDRGTAISLAPQFVRRQAADSIEGLIAIGMTFVILTAGIDLSVGSLVACAGLVAAMIAKGNTASSFSLSASAQHGYGWFAAMLVGVLGGVIRGRRSRG